MKAVLFLVALWSVAVFVPSVECACPDNCSGHGRCVQDACICTEEYQGKNCAAFCPANCHNSWEQGFCNLTQLNCSCTPYFIGNDCGIPFDRNTDWDNIECMHGGRLFPPKPTNGTQRYCECAQGWTGRECSVCTNSSSCGKGKTCDNSLILSDSKFYDCNKTSFTDITGYDTWIIHCDFPTDNVPGSCLSRQYREDTGIPLAYNCSFSDCVKKSYSSTKQAIACQNTKCRCTSWCGDIVRDMINGMHGAMTLACDQDDKICVFNQDGFAQLNMGNITLSCKAGECH